MEDWTAIMFIFKPTLNKRHYSIHAVKVKDVVTSGDAEAILGNGEQISRSSKARQKGESTFLGFSVGEANELLLMFSLSNVPVWNKYSADTVIAIRKYHDSFLIDFT